MTLMSTLGGVDRPLDPKIFMEPTKSMCPSNSSRPNLVSNLSSFHLYDECTESPNPAPRRSDSIFSLDRPKDFLLRTSVTAPTHGQKVPSFSSPPPHNGGHRVFLPRGRRLECYWWRSSTSFHRRRGHTLFPGYLVLRGPPFLWDSYYRRQVRRILLYPPS